MYSLHLFTFIGATDFVVVVIRFDVNAFFYRDKTWTTAKAMQQNVRKKWKRISG